MKKAVGEFLNSILSPLGVSLVSSRLGGFTMLSAVKRIAEHGIPIKSIIDIGASNGKWSVETMKVFPKASYFAVEPLRERRDALEKLKNRYSNFNYGLCVAGDNDGEEVTLNVSRDLDGSTVNGKHGEPRSVPMTTVDAIVAGNSLEGPYLIKFDTHGYELPILKGAKNTLSKTNVIIMEVYNFQLTENALRFHEMCTHMEQLGFRCYDIVGLLLRDHDNAFWQMDILFTRVDSGIFKYSQYQ